MNKYPHELYQHTRHKSSCWGLQQQWQQFTQLRLMWPAVSPQPNGQFRFSPSLPLQHEGHTLGKRAAHMHQGFPSHVLTLPESAPTQIICLLMSESMPVQCILYMYMIDVHFEAWCWLEWGTASSKQDAAPRYIALGKH